ncbi:MAG: Coenzyme F420 hydrogenase/dehydrogenase, beta subunit C-terminal domain [Candidatus Hodarchaeales archaeon]|jgi:coenzyme F420 hydrogenase subunit beta
MFELESKVISQDLCTFCGACATVCDRITMDQKAGVPKFEGICQEENQCVNVCPRLSLDVESLENSAFGEQRTDYTLGVIGKTVRARSKDSDVAKGAQSGGFVSSLLISALEKGTIDGAIVASSDFTKDEEPWPIIADSKETILAASGSKYTPTPTILGVQQAVEQGYQKIALVGLPCHIEAFRNLQTCQFDFAAANRVVLTIGLFCSKSFSYNPLMQVSKEMAGEEKIRKFDCKGPSFYIFTEKEKEYKVPLKDLDAHAREGCRFCIDYTAELADISVGSVGSPAGYSSVIIRNKNGLEAVNLATEQGYIEVQDMNSDDINKIRKQALKKKKAGFRKIISRVSPVKLMHLVLNPNQLRIEPLLEQT